MTALIYSITFSHLGHRDCQVSQLHWDRRDLCGDGHEGDVSSGEIPSLPQGSRLNRLAVFCREKIHLLQDFTYLFTDEEALICFTNELDKTLSFLRRRLPFDGGLVLERGQRPQKTKKRGVDTSSSHKKTSSLPLHRKRRRTPRVQQHQKGKTSEDNTVIDGTFDHPEGKDQQCILFKVN